MIIYNLLDVGHAAIAELYGVPVENFPQFETRWKRSFNRLMNALPMLVLTFLLYGGLSHITFLCRWLLRWWLESSLNL